MYFNNFNPPAPCGTGHYDIASILEAMRFQSTRPLRDGTPSNFIEIANTEFQSTRPLRDGTV